MFSCTVSVRWAILATNKFSNISISGKKIVLNYFCLAFISGDFFYVQNDYYVEKKFSPRRKCFFFIPDFFMYTKCFIHGDNVLSVEKKFYPRMKFF